MIRERAACGLAQSGMLSEKQRRTAVPRLLEFAEDPALDPETRKWVYQALRDITGQSLPHDPAAWRNWYNSNNTAGSWTPVTRFHVAAAYSITRPRRLVFALILLTLLLVFCD